MSLTNEQFKIIKEEAEPIIYSVLRKEAFLLAQSLEPQIFNLQNADPELFKDAKKLVVQLKWTGCALMKDEEDFFQLFKEALLEGVEMEKEYLWQGGLTDIILEKLTIQFGVGLQKTVYGMLLGMRENTQIIGQNSITVKNEKRPVRPYIRHWLIDFLRNTASEKPGEIEEANYLFNNANTKNLSDEDKKTLSKVLALYDTFRLLAQQLALEERARLMPSPGEPVPLVAQPRQRGGEETFFDNEERERPTPLSSSSASTPAKRPVPPPPVLPSQPTIPASALRKDTYKEAVSDEDLAGPQSIRKPVPRLDGNVVDLKNINDR